MFKFCHGAIVASLLFGTAVWAEETVPTDPTVSQNKQSTRPHGPLKAMRRALAEAETDEQRRQIRKKFREKIAERRQARAATDSDRRERHAGHGEAHRRRHQDQREAHQEKHPDHQAGDHGKIRRRHRHRHHDRLEDVRDRREDVADRREDVRDGRRGPSRTGPRRVGRR